MPNFRNWLRPIIRVSRSCTARPWPLACVLVIITTALPTTCRYTSFPLWHAQQKTSETEERGELVAAFVGAALAFGVGIWATLGPDKAAQYFAGYLLEQSLSVDNLFVFVLVFDYFKTDQQGQDKVRAARAAGS